jgi:hypothetical protein
VVGTTGHTMLPVLQSSPTWASAGCSQADDRRHHDRSTVEAPLPTFRAGRLLRIPAAEFERIISQGVPFAFLFQTDRVVG